MSLGRVLPGIALVAAFGSCVAGCSRHRGPGALSPEQSIKTFHLSLRVDLFAAEPNVVDPVEIVFDEDGRAYVAEMRDYPDDPRPGQPPRSRIRLLEDTDGDGTIDRSVVFADNLLQATSMLPWKGGLIVTSAPDILYLKDLDGDGKADVRTVLFTGFALVNPESRITNLERRIVGGQRQIGAGLEYVMHRLECVAKEGVIDIECFALPFVADDLLCLDSLKISLVSL